MSDSDSKLTDAQKAKIERNRQRALLLRQARLAAQPYHKEDRIITKEQGSSRLIDTGGGFFLEESEAQEVVKPRAITVKPPPSIPPELHNCEECQKTFYESYLYLHFGVKVCDDCRDNDDKHALITKTDAKNEFLLKDVDIDQREPPLKFILHKNPHNSRWGDMKLYLRSQVSKRALEVWGSEDEIEERKVQRAANREKLNQKKYNKKVKELRMAVRSSTYTKNLSGHEHKYGGEKYDEAEDMYSKTCETCGHIVTYEKM